MNKLPLQTRVQILSMLCEGSSMRSVSRVTDVSINTVAKLLVDAGKACAAYHDQYVRGSVHTNTIEAFWANLKRGIKGTYVWVSKKHLQSYLREFEYRHNLRHAPYLMFDCLLQAFPKVRVE